MIWHKGNRRNGTPDHEPFVAVCIEDVGIAESNKDVRFAMRNREGRCEELFSFGHRKFVHRGQLIESSRHEFEAMGEDSDDGAAEQGQPMVRIKL